MKLAENVINRFERESGCIRLTAAITSWNYSSNSHNSIIPFPFTCIIIETIHWRYKNEHSTYDVRNEKTD